MGDNLYEANVVDISGEILSDIEYSHKMYGEGFYNFQIKVDRLSSYSDILPVTVSERLLVNMNLKKGQKVYIKGQIRSYNKHVDGKNKLILTVFAREITFVDNEDVIKNPNKIFLNGYICKEPVYRTTPLGREITDLLIAVNRAYNKSDYIPCIAWGRNAKFSEELKIGTNIRIWGRMQSREYKKKISEEDIVTKTAYEISILKMECDEIKEEIEEEND